LENLE
jgi:hypothetical protein